MNIDCPAYTYYIDLPRIALFANSAWWWKWMRKRHRGLTLAWSGATSKS
jgi:hypothetical protein